MFCRQCEQTANGTGCTNIGVCGKSEDIASLQDILIIAMKGIAAYAYHAKELGATDPEVDAFLYEGLFSTLTNVDFDLGRFITMNLKAGKMCFKIMELLDKTHTERFGNPIPTEVSTSIIDGHGILVTGHDLLDLSELLKQTEGKGINIYTHGEMLPAHGYPELKKYSHLIGNWGRSWVGQKQEFEDFPGAILATTNCVVKPKDSYKNRIFTCGIAGLEGVIHIAERNFEPIIQKALQLPALSASENERIVTGFHHTNVLTLADKIVSAVKEGKIKHFFLIAGCDCPGKGMEYYAEFVKAVPKNCVIFTLACGKFRFNHENFGEIDGIPRLIDLGQCNNAYSAVQIAVVLAGVFGCGVNDLPLSIVLSWFEQKAVAILLSLFYLGIKGIRIGPKPPAFVSEGVFKILQDTFDLKLIGEPKDDLAKILG